MDISEYQRQALVTDQFSGQTDKILHALLNLTESVGAVHRVIEQGHRDKSLPEQYVKDRVSKKLGDILWYVANIASRKGVDLSVVATQNLERTVERWGRTNELRGRHFDDTLPAYERLPRKFRVAFFEPTPQLRPRKIMIAIPSDEGEWIQVGDRIDDNTEPEDGYRFHDVLHLANAAHLGWSPVIRALLRRKRKSDPNADRVEDGARAINIEEALTAFVFAHASELDYFRDTNNIEFGLLKTIERLTRGLEVRHRSYEDWERAILDGFKMFREIRTKGEGLVVVDLNAEENRMTLEVLPPDVKRELLPRV